MLTDERVRELVSEQLSRTCGQLERRLRSLEERLDHLQDCVGEDSQSVQAAPQCAISCWDPAVEEKSFADPPAGYSSLVGDSSRILMAMPNRAQSPAPEPTGHDVADCDVQLPQLDRDVFGMATTLFVSNFDEGRPAGVRAARVVFTFLLLLIALSLQAGIMWEAYHFVTAKQVHDVRVDYDDYEIHMYGNNTSRMDLTPNGKHRGRAEFFQPELFDTMPHWLKAKTCRIPFSQPVFFMVILFIWSTTCLAELRGIITRGTCLVLRTKTSSSMDVVFEGKYRHVHARVIQQLTLKIKAALIVFVMLPRLLITASLLWLGCRWLAATNSFAGLIWNVVALEFVLKIQELVYHAMTPTSIQMEDEQTYMLPMHDSLQHSYQILWDVLLWLSVSIAWVSLYVYKFQLVLPDYRWDVHAVCTAWISQRFAI